MVAPLHSAPGRLRPGPGPSRPAGPRGVAAAAAVLALAACATRRPTDSLGEALRQASTAMTAGDAATLHGMLSERLVVGVSVDSLAAAMAEDRAEYAELAAGLLEPAAIAIEADVETGEGDPLVFVLEDGAWKLLTPVIEPPLGAADPISALRLFADVLAGIRDDLSESGVLAQQHDTGIVLLLTTLADEISEVTAENLVLEENRCYVTLPSGRKIELVREGDMWKVSSIFPPLQF